MKLTHGKRLSSSLLAMRIIREKLDSGEAAIIGLYEPPISGRPINPENVIRLVFPEEVINRRPFNSMSTYWFSYVEPEVEGRYVRTSFGDREAWVLPIQQITDIVNLFAPDTGGTIVDFEEVRRSYLRNFEYSDYDSYVRAIRYMAQNYSGYIRYIEIDDVRERDYQMVALRHPDAVCIRGNGMVMPVYDTLFDPPETRPEPNYLKFIGRVSYEEHSQPPIENAYFINLSPLIEPSDKYGDTIYNISTVKEFLSKASRVFVNFRFERAQEWLVIHEYMSPEFKDGFAEAAVAHISSGANEEAED